ncbi:hypothetical protein RCL_jg16829.t1 [Rhizophagus clarus]|uniref:Uncharacterized protein n=1 Tax=Rhizophagus clarus TaxID=94130 RepID=A0A8H3LGA3_9GLOM|nr:hypothetical protein RCL_jg16829.t1 [Rhizophagus clarus]
MSHNLSCLAFLGIEFSIRIHSEDFNNSSSDNNLSISFGWIKNNRTHRNVEFKIQNFDILRKITVPREIIDANNKFKLKEYIKYDHLVMLQLLHHIIKMIRTFISQDVNKLIVSRVEKNKADQTIT